jgi:hypothetical protein
MSQVLFTKIRAMKRYLNVQRLVAVVLSVSMLYAITSCDKEPVSERPELPPLESLVMDFSDFSQQPGGVKDTEVTYENFLHAYFSVVFWNIASVTTLAVPIAAYTHAFQQEPEYLGDHTWEWSFEFSLGSGSYTATLTGVRINNEEFSMEMVIASSAAPEQGMKWFDGVVRYDHTHASWNLFGEGGVKMLEAEWNKDFETEAGDLTYTYVEPDREETGSYIMVSYMPDAVYDASYTISLANGETLIEWNTTTLEGRVKDLAAFGDSEWHCWDSAANGLADMICG